MILFLLGLSYEFKMLSPKKMMYGNEVQVEKTLK